MDCSNYIQYVILLHVGLLCVLLPLLVFIMSSVVSEQNEGGWVVECGRSAIDTLSHYVTLIGSMLIAYIYGIYRQVTFRNMFIFTLKYVPMGYYFYKTLEKIYVSSRDSIKKKQSEIDDIQLQIQITKAKIKVCEVQFAERSAEARRFGEKLCEVRARVRGVLAADESLRQMLNMQVLPIDEEHIKTSPEEEYKLKVAFMKNLKENEFAVSETTEDKAEECAAEERAAENNSKGYSNHNDADTKSDCRVKIVKVTNVYRVACLKHYIKQKRLRRANQQELLKKKIEDIRMLLQNWQKSLNAVLYSKLYNVPVPMASQEAGGDYSKPRFQDFSDSDSELKTSAENLFDEYWSQTSYGYSCDAEQPEQRTCYHAADFGEAPPTAPRCGCERGVPGELFILPEETTSQVAIEDYENEQQ